MTVIRSAAAGTWLVYMHLLLSDSSCSLWGAAPGICGKGGLCWQRQARCCSRSDRKAGLCRQTWCQAQVSDFLPRFGAEHCR